MKNIKKLVILSIVVLLAIATLPACSACRSEEAERPPADNGNEQFEEFSRSSAEFVRGIVAGWNLGNTLDSTINIWTSGAPWSDPPTVYEQETQWENPQTTKEMIDFVAQSGFNGLRIPVTWYHQTTNIDGRYVVNEEWLDRVQQIADYGIDNNMHVIINMHHDDTNWLDISVSEQDWEGVKAKYTDIWSQVAERFSDYGERLILASMNEPIFFGPYIEDVSEREDSRVGRYECWWGHTDDYYAQRDCANICGANPLSARIFERINEIHQIFVQTVRNSGGNNSYRYLVLNTLGAQRYPHQFENLWTPEDDSRIIVGFHWYVDRDPGAHGDDWNSFENTFSRWSDFAEERGVGVIIGEGGLRREGAANHSLAAAWSRDFVGTARRFNIPFFQWDDGGWFRQLDRSANPPQWLSPQYIEAVIEAAS